MNRAGGGQAQTRISLDPLLGSSMCCYLTEKTCCKDLNLEIGGIAGYSCVVSRVKCGKICVNKHHFLETSLPYLSTILKSTMSSRVPAVAVSL